MFDDILDKKKKTKTVKVGVAPSPKEDAGDVYSPLTGNEVQRLVKEYTEFLKVHNVSLGIGTTTPKVKLEGYKTFSSPGVPLYEKTIYNPMLDEAKELIEAKELLIEARDCIRELKQVIEKQKIEMYELKQVIEKQKIDGIKTKVIWISEINLLVTAYPQTSWV